MGTGLDAGAGPFEPDPRAAEEFPYGMGGHGQA